jgi:hypothetical protein
LLPLGLASVYPVFPPAIGLVALLRVAPLRPGIAGDKGGKAGQESANHPAAGGGAE